MVSPIDCDLNGPCYIQQYVDHDASENASDFNCSGLSYDGHKGTDFALPTYDMIANGVNVVASAAGTIGGLRDGMDDIRYTGDSTDDIAGRECGNGVVIRHGGGWETQYCHLRKGSITVDSGQTVQAGEILGQVGMSGRAAFPHVHLSVRRDGAVVDPFDPDGTIVCGEPETDTLWSELPAYRPGGILTVGTAAAIPEFEDIRANTVVGPDGQSDALVIYAFLFGTREGDVVELSLSGPDGTVIERDIEIDRTQAQSFRAIGKKRRDEAWTVGTYTGVAVLSRSGDPIDRQETILTLR